jgi:predicted phosphoadenosine phosphosulfate sulfurtransferase
MDYECQYSMTTDYVLKMEHDNADVLEVYHCCMPFKVSTCTSMYQSYWRPWEESKKDIWVRQMPDDSLTSADFPFFDKSMWDYDFQDRFGQWLSEKKGCRICGMIGIRTSESLNRWRAIHSERNYKKYKGKEWTKDMENGVINAYPIYDWKVDDVWLAAATIDPDLTEDQARDMLRDHVEFLTSSDDVVVAGDGRLIGLKIL